MGKLLVGHYGQEPSAESVSLSLRECHLKLGLRPDDFISAEPPEFFRERRGATGKYLVFYLPGEEIDNAVWRTGYYLLPKDAKDVLAAFHKVDSSTVDAVRKPIELICRDTPPAGILERARRWAEDSQPLFFKCRCPQLLLRLDPPRILRRRWKARLSCPKRCQPPLKTEV